MIQTPSSTYLFKNTKSYSRLRQEIDHLYSFGSSEFYINLLKENEDHAMISRLFIQSQYIVGKGMIIFIINYLHVQQHHHHHHVINCDLGIIYE